MGKTILQLCALSLVLAWTTPRAANLLSDWEKQNTGLAANKYASEKDKTMKKNSSLANEQQKIVAKQEEQIKQSNEEQDSILLQNLFTDASYEAFAEQDEIAFTNLENKLI